MRISQLTFIAFYLNSELDSGEHTDCTVEEVSQHIKAGTIFDYLRNILGDDIEILDSSDQQVLITEWKGYLSVMDTRRKLGVENKGLCLLIAYLLEGIQRRKNTDTPIDNLS